MALVGVCGEIVSCLRLQLHRGQLQNGSEATDFTDEALNVLWNRSLSRRVGILKLSITFVVFSYRLRK